MPNTTRQTLASVQQHYVQAREILGDVLCVQSATSPTRRDYRAVVEVSLLNFLLRAEEEQTALLERYRSLLKSLTFPIQILVRNTRLDLRPTIARIEAQRPVGCGQWPELADELARMLKDLGQSRTLVERHCYLILPAPPIPPLAGRRVRRRRTRRVRQADLMARALQELAIRVEMLQQQLAGLGLRAHRVAGVELAAFYFHCLTPERALQHPLQRAHLAAVGRTPRVAKRRPEAPVLPSEQGQPYLSPPAPHVERRPPLSLPHKQQQEALPPFDLLRFADLLAPGSIEEFPDALCVGGEWVRGIVVTAFPHEVAMGAWLAPLLLHDALLEIVFHLHPQPQAQVLRSLKRRRTGYASSRSFQRRQGRGDDPEMELAQHDVTRLMSQLAAGDERAFELSFLLLVRAPDRAALEERAERIMALLQTVLLDAVAHPATFEQAQAFRSSLPLGRDELRRTISLDATSVASTFPFLSNSLVMPEGIFLGLSSTGEPVLLDPWHASLENPHCFLGGVTGAGKSVVAKILLERALLTNGPQNERHAVIDPDGEFSPLAEGMGGSLIWLASGSMHHLNPFDLIPPGRDLATYLREVARIDRLAEKILDLHSLLDLMLADHGSTLSMREKALLDRALYETYRRVGISPDPRTHYHPPPLLRDLAEVLASGVCGPDEFDLGLRLSRYTEGSLAGLFANHTNVQLDSHLLIWNVHDMRGDLRPIGIFLIADAIWTQALSHSTVRRSLTIDEAASLIEHPEGGRFLANLSRRARKRSLRLVISTQNPETFVEDQWGSVIAANAAIKILKKQDRTSIKAVAQRFGLTPGEAQRLIACSVQEALVLAGDRRVVLSVPVNEREYPLVTTSPVGQDQEGPGALLVEYPSTQEREEDQAQRQTQPLQSGRHSVPPTSREEDPQ